MCEDRLVFQAAQKILKPSQAAETGMGTASLAHALERQRELAWVLWGTHGIKSGSAGKKRYLKHRQMEHLEHL